MDFRKRYSSPRSRDKTRPRFIFPTITPVVCTVYVPPAENNLSPPHCIRRRQNLWAFLSLSNNYMNKSSKVSAPTHKKLLLSERLVERPCNCLLPHHQLVFKSVLVELSLGGVEFGLEIFRLCAHLVRHHRKSDEHQEAAGRDA